MQTRISFPLWLRRWIWWTGISILFALAYAQSPLYTSNQNQYFLHGLAQAGFGYLQKDWLANTSDPTPLFSLLISATYRLVRWPEIYYVYYAALMGVYVYSLLGIASHLYGWQEKPLKRLVFMAVLFLIHSAAWRFAAARLLGVSWTYVLEDGVAGQRMLGPVFQPSSFGVLLALSLHLFLQKRPYLATLAAVGAATFHPTYLLSAGVLVAGYLYDAWRQRGQVGQAIKLGLWGLILVAPGLSAAFAVFSQGDAQLAAQARQILIDYRIPHHALVAEWLNGPALVKMALVALALYRIRGGRLFPVLAWATLVAVALTLARVLLDSSVLALLFPWRLSIFIVPISVAILIGWLLEIMFALPALQSARGRALIQYASLLVVMGVVVVGGVRFVLDLERKANAPERPMQAYVARHKSPEDVYLTPVKMQDFRLVTGAPVYVDFKSIPYQAADVLEWRRRMQLADRFYIEQDCERLAKLFTEEDVTHVVLARDQKAGMCPDLRREYSDSAYAVFSYQPSR